MDLEEQVQHEPYYASAEPWVPQTNDLDEVRQASKACQGCHLWRIGTQTVFGEGSPRARIIMVGEQPGDREDIEGRPFVGPAGKLLHKALLESGIAPEEVYLTNAVKHFKWTPKGSRRIHKKPNRSEINACRPWLDMELELVKPEALVLLGATAAQAVLGPSFRVSEERGKLLDHTLAPVVMATVHPASVLRARDDKSRREQREAFLADLSRLTRALQQRHAS